MSNLVDPFDLLQRLDRRDRMVRLFGFTGWLVGLLGIATVMIVALSPTPVVIWTDNPQIPPKLVQTGTVEVREIEAKRFFLVMADKLLKWNSADVMTRFAEARLMMNTDWRSIFDQSIAKVVDVPKEVVPSGKATAQEWMIRSAVRNEIEPIKLEDIKCERAAKQWNCTATIRTKAMPMLAPPDEANSVERRVVVRAGFKEYDVTDAALYGLLVSYWEVLDKEED
jgi:hypothetical protein